MRIYADSSWIRSVDYVRLADGVERTGWPPPTGFLIIESQTGARYAYLVPGWVFGLFAAAVARGQSLGRLFNRNVRGRFPSVKVPTT